MSANIMEAGRQNFSECCARDFQNFQSRLGGKDKDTPNVELDSLLVSSLKHDGRPMVIVPMSRTEPTSTLANSGSQCAQDRGDSKLWKSHGK